MPVEEPEVNAPPEEAGVLEDLPVLTVRDTVIYPGALLPITVGRPSSLALVQSLGENRTLAVVSQLDPRVESPAPEDLYQVGTVCVMHKAIKVPKDNLLLFCEGIARIRTQEFTATEPFLRARVERLARGRARDHAGNRSACGRTWSTLFQQIVSASPNLSDELSVNAANIAEPGRLADFIAGNTALPEPHRAAASAGATGR